MVGRTIQVRGFDVTDSANSAESVKDLLEKIAGTGTICAIKLRPPTAIVQFQTQESASLVEDAARRNALRIGRFYLKARPAHRDIIPRPRIPIFSLEDTVLHLGCLVKENILFALFSASNVSVQFGFDMKKIYFYLSYNLTKYKLELSYESIPEMQLHRPPAHRSRTKFLLIQVQAAPKIYELLPRRQSVVIEDSFFNWLRYDTDEQWTRAVDFTPSASIGQSSIFCLEVPQQCELPRIGDYFVYYKEKNLDFECRIGNSYSCGNRLVPFVKSPDYIEVPYEILFTVNQLVQNGTLSGPTVDYITEAIDFKEEYDFRLGNLMDHYGIKSEAEIISGCILKMAKNFTKSSDADAIRMAVRSLRKEARSWFNEMSTGEDGHDMIEAKASAWYHVTYHPQYWGSYNEGCDRPHLISFPWCVYDKLLIIKKRRQSFTQMDPNLVSLMNNMNQNLRFH